MALQIETIRATADRIAASHGLEIVDLEFTGGVKHRALRVFVEKDAEGRAKLAAESESAAADLPRGVPAELLSGVTHEDCAAFARDFGTVLDVEDLVPGAEYTLEVSSPGLERKLLKPADYERFAGRLAKIWLTEPIENQKYWEGRLAGENNGIVKLAVRDHEVSVPYNQIRKANLVVEL